MIFILTDKGLILSSDYKILNFNPFPQRLLLDFTLNEILHEKESWESSNDVIGYKRGPVN